VKTGLNLGGPSPKAKYLLATDSESSSARSDRPERGSDDRHNTPTYGASGALPPFRETYLPGEARDLLPVSDNTGSGTDKYLRRPYRVRSPYGATTGFLGPVGLTLIPANTGYYGRPGGS
jgi:hypothetical protein